MLVPIDIEAKNKEFVKSLYPGMLIRMASTKTNIVLLHAERLLEALNEKGRDFSDINANELDDVIFDRYEEVVVGTHGPKELNKKWFMLLNPVPITIWNYDKNIALSHSGVNCLRFIEILWGEKRVYLCYTSDSLTLLGEEWRIHGREKAQRRMSG